MVALLPKGVPSSC